MNTILSAACLVMIAGAASADTTKVGPSKYKIDQGVAFDLTNEGATDYYFEWTDNSGIFSGIADPTLVLVAGETYTFMRQSAGHPFVITDDTLPVAGEDGEMTRLTSDGAVIDAATLTPLADFTADPAPTSDLITWTPSVDDIGTYFYTCRISGHVAMTGKIEVVAADEPCLPDVNGDGTVTPTDFTAWINAFNNNLPECDQNGDGSCTPTDFTAWIANYNAGC